MNWFRNNAKKFYKIMMQEQLDTIEKKLDKITTALVGNEFNSKGLVHRVEAVEKYQESDKKEKWMVAGGVVVIGGLIKFWDKIFHI